MYSKIIKTKNKTKSMKSIALVGAPNTDLALILKSKEYATQAGKPGQANDGRVVIQAENGKFVICTGLKSYKYEDGCSEYWTSGKTPKGTKWNVIYTFESVTLYTVPDVLDLISDINATNDNGRKVNRNQGVNYIELFGIKK
jgi:hypothetical protein